MASKNSRKEYLQNSYYHIYNRGVEKRDIFMDEQDYQVFLGYLKTYLLPQNTKELMAILSQPDIDYKKRNEIARMLSLNNFSKEIDLLAYSLMPNHFHFLLFQYDQYSIDSFINSLCTRYVMYFNKKYGRVGHLYQDVYKAVRVTSDEQLLYLTAYIHKNLIKNERNDFSITKDIINQQSSSLADYLGFRKTNWVKTQTVLSYFSKSNRQKSYPDFVLGEKGTNGINEKLLLDS